MENSQTTFVIDRDALQVIQSRVFDAPAALVFKVVTDPALIPQWWGPRSLTTTVDKMDVKEGGAWRFVQNDENGEYAFRGEYLEIQPPNKIVQTFEFELMAGHIITETATLEETDGKTLYKVVSQYASLEDLEGMIESGMEEGSVESVERLAEVLEQRL